MSHLYLFLSTFFFFFNDTATTEIYTLSLHDALPICDRSTAVLDQPRDRISGARRTCRLRRLGLGEAARDRPRSEEHTSELQSLAYLVCRLLLEKKKQYRTKRPDYAQTASHQRSLCGY